MNDFIVPDRKGLVGEWLLNGNANDTSGNGYNGTPLNVTYSKTDRGYQTYKGDFNGSSSKVDFSSFPALGDYTISFLAKGQLSGAAYFFIGTSANNANTQILASDNNDGRLRVVTYDGIVRQTYSTDALPTDKFTHVVVQRSGSTVSIFFNSKLDSSGTHMTATTGTDRVSFGYQVLYNNYFLGVPMQSVRIFNRALSETEIRNWYLESIRALGGSTLSELMSGCVAYYDFRGDANDIVGGFDGTVNGATLTTDRFGNANSAYSFDGVNDIISSSNFNPGISSVSVNIFIKNNNTSQTNRYVLEKGNNVSNDFAVIYGYSAGNYEFFATNYDLRTSSQIACPTDGKFHLLTYQYGSGVVTGYLDGVLKFSRSVSITLDNTSTPFYIGGSAVADYISADIDTIIISNKRYSDSEIKSLYELFRQSKLLPFA